jgi:hypothetical protein
MLMTFLKVAMVVALVASGATLAVGQGQVGQGQNPTGDPRPLTPGGADKLG